MINLTQIEQEIMPHVLVGLDSKKIASLIYRTEGAVKARKAKIFKKFNVKNTEQLIGLASKKGLFFVNDSGIKQSYKFDVNKFNESKKEQK